jgi:hypothetical protein
MPELQNGRLVRHNTLGVGKIVALEPDAVHVFFRGGDKRFAAKLRLPAARPLLRTDGLEPDVWLEGLTAFVFDPLAGRYGLTASWLTHAQAIEQFLALHPEGFRRAGTGPGTPDRAARWTAAHTSWTEHLGGGEGERLLADGDLKTLVRRILVIEKAIASLLGPSDKDAVKNALAEEVTASAFLGALFELLSATTPGRTRFEALFRAARALPVEPAQQWLVATLFPFLAAPSRHVLLRPRSSGHAAERLGCSLGAAGPPAWPAYAALRELSVRLLEGLAPHGAKDFADVEYFLHVTAGTRGPARQPLSPRPAGARAAARSRS